jgi:hypothetical protein
MATRGQKKKLTSVDDQKNIKNKVDEKKVQKGQTDDRDEKVRKHRATDIQKPNKNTK